jgi:hypothetical protein
MQETDLEDEWTRAGLNRPEARRLAQQESWRDPEAVNDRMWD